MSRETIVSQHRQDQILLLAITDSEFLSQVRQSFKPAYLSSAITGNILRICYAYFDIYKIAPQDHLHDELVDFLKGKTESDKKNYVTYLNRINEMSIPNRAYVIDKLNDFIKARIYAENTIEIVRLSERGKFKEAEEMMQATLKSNINRTDFISSMDLQPVIISMDEVEPQEIDWLWENRIPKGSVTLFVGDPGKLKSFLSLYIAATVSHGSEWPDLVGAPCCGSTIILNAEDGVHDTIRPRLDGLEADVSKIKVLKAVIEDGEEAFFNLGRHLPALEETVSTTPDTQLVVIDPISAYLGKTDSHVNAQVRGVFAPLAMLAEKYKIAVIGISHLNKNQQASLIYRTIGSIAFNAAARAVWLVTEDTNDEDRRLLLPIKTNLSKKPSGLAFTLVDGSIEFEPGEIHFTASEMVEAKPDSRTPALDSAVDWLLEALEGGSVWSTKIVDKAREEARITFDTLIRAKKKLNVRSKIKVTDGHRKSYWVLPNKTE